VKSQTALLALLTALSLLASPASLRATSLTEEPKAIPSQLAQAEENSRDEDLLRVIAATLAKLGQYDRALEIARTMRLL